MTHVQDKVAQPVTTTAELQVACQEIDTLFAARMTSSYWNWRSLFDRDSNAAIVQHPDCVLAELSSPRTPQNYPAYWVEVSLKHEVLGGAILVPKAVSGVKKFGPRWNLKGFYLVGGRCLGPEDANIQRALMSGIESCLQQTRSDFVLIENIEVDDPLLLSLQAKQHGLRLFTPTAFQPLHKIELPNTFADYEAKFSSKTRNTLRRKRKQFGEYRFERITEPEQIPDFLAHAHEIAKHSWQSKLLGLRIANNAYELRSFTTLALERALRCYLLWKDDVPVSFCVGTQHNGVFHYEEVAYDQRRSEGSPGQMLILLMLEDLMQVHRPRVFSFGFGDADYKRQFANLTTSSGNVWLLKPGLKSQLIEGYFLSRSWAVQTARKVLAKAGVLTQFRNWLRRGNALAKNHQSSAQPAQTPATHD